MTNEHKHCSADTETVTEGCSDEHCEFFEMLWKWFADESRHGKAEMRSNNINGGLSAADFEEMLNEHEANIMHVPPQALPTRDKIARTLAYEEWPLAMQDERQRWADRNWEKWLRQADAILALTRPQPASQ